MGKGAGIEGRRTRWRLLVVDSGGVSALVERSEDAVVAVKVSFVAAVRVVVPSVILAESLRGDSGDAPTNPVLSSLEVADIGEREAREAARLKKAARMSGVQHTIDALVVAVASLGGGGAILTSDVGDMEALAAGCPNIPIVPIRA